MGLKSWIAEHHLEARKNRVVYDSMQVGMGERGVYSALRSSGSETSKFLGDAVFIVSAIRSRGNSLSGRAQVDATLKQGIFYDPGYVDSSSYGSIGYLAIHAGKVRAENKLRRDSIGILPSREISSQAKTTSGTKSSRGRSLPQMLKPFWSNGKPKCRKGYRYDFKRKMCVKKS